MHLELAWHYIGTVLLHLFDLLMSVVSLYEVAFTLTLLSWHNNSFLGTNWFLLLQGLCYDERSLVLGPSFPSYLGALGTYENSYLGPTKCIFPDIHATRPILCLHSSYVFCELAVSPYRRCRIILSHSVFEQQIVGLLLGCSSCDVFDIIIKFYGLYLYRKCQGSNSEISPKLGELWTKPGTLRRGMMTRGLISRVIVRVGVMSRRPVRRGLVSRT